MSTEDHPDWWRPVGGQNSQDSILERRSLVWNDNDVEAPDAPPASYEDVDHKGKFFTRGCRGMIEQIGIYCIRTVAGTLTLSISPHPCMGPLYTVVITPGAAWAWVAADFEQMWNYDSLFIWVSACSADVSWAYDAVLPYDGHWSQDTGATWEDMAIRPFIRVFYTGETPGDVPVSGIVNTIPIPNIAAEIEVGLLPNLPNAAYTTICDAVGAGTMLEARVYFRTSVAPTPAIVFGSVWYELHIYADGALAYHTTNRIICQSEIATAGRSSVGEFYQATVADPAYNMTVLAVRMPIQYRRTIRMRVFQSSGGAVSTTGHIFANELR